MSKKLMKTKTTMAIFQAKGDSRPWFLWVLFRLYFTAGRTGKVAVRPTIVNILLLSLWKINSSAIFFHLPGSCWPTGLFCLELHCLWCSSLLNRVNWAGRTGRDSAIPNSRSYEFAEIFHFILCILYIL